MLSNLSTSCAGRLLFGTQTLSELVAWIKSEISESLQNMFKKMYLGGLFFLFSVLLFSFVKNDNNFLHDTSKRPKSTALIDLGALGW